MEEWVHAGIREVVALPQPILWIALVLSSALEYVFPPFPGDAVLIAGGIIASSQKLLWIPIHICVTAGAVLGALVDYEIGRWLRREDRNTWLHRWTRRPKVAKPIERVISGFQRHGDLYLIVNRFLPGLRGVFFVAAGLARLRRLRVLVLAAIAAILWNSMLLGVGLLVGANLEALSDFLDTYSRVAWVVVGIIVAIVVWRLVRK
jgi:membrane protein DedA with SNARE-associated domain